MNTSHKPNAKIPVSTSKPETDPSPDDSQLNFIEQIVEEDLRTGKWDARVATRFPPEPNGYLHIGHAKSICLNFGLAAQYGGSTNLRFDDTNPTKEEQEYVDAIKEDVSWLGFEWQGKELFASDYFDQMFEWAVQLITAGKAYVCDLTTDEVREYRGTLTSPGRESPYRDRAVDENLDLFHRMKQGEFSDGTKTLRAKIDMSAPNFNLRDPVMYRILHAQHHRTGDKWCVYPMYDFAHGQSDSIERVTHSICTLEFENHRPLYDWFCDELGIFHPQQIEFARLNLTYTVMSKRRLLELVRDGHVRGWDDPRMPTISGLRRRGYTPEAIREFCRRIGVTKFDGVTEFALLDHCLREDLNRRSPRVMVVLNPLKVVVENYEEGRTEEMEAVNNPEDPAAGKRQVPFSREIYIERDDFMEDPPKKFFRMAPGREVRLRYAYLVTCTEVIKNDAGEVIEVRCTHDPATRGGSAPDGRKVKGTIHWVSAAHARPAEVRLYNHLFDREDPDEVENGGNWLSNLNPESLEVKEQCQVEPSLDTAQPGERYQFERLGYYCVDRESTPTELVFNRTVTLRDSWSKISKKR
jgi:glutaminyl-tRNA synthetase